MKTKSAYNIEVWGGLECSVNRVENDFFDQLDYSGHYNRDNDINEFARLGFKKMRYPLLWETHQPEKDTTINWSHSENRLDELHNNGIDIIAGLVHHGSGPAYVSMMDETFANGLGEYAARVAEKFPWIDYYTPVNEPLTTARFCGLYGIWSPHQKDDRSFCRILINECMGTVLAMQAIRKINPDAKLVQTDDLGKIHSTPLLHYQADFENTRRWLSYDLLCAKVNKEHPLWSYVVGAGITEDELQFFLDNKCEPAIMGFNHYLTSERYLDENISVYPPHTHGGNGRHQYADVEAVRVGNICPDGPYRLLKEAWERYHLPMAVTEVHLYCTREEQMRWLSLLWTAANQLRYEGVDIRAITAWALLGSFGWNRLLTQPNGDYEPGVFDLCPGKLRPTALAQMIAAYNFKQEFNHPVINNKGWWQRDCRVIFGDSAISETADSFNNTQPLLIVGKTSALADAFARICGSRGIVYKLFGSDELDITDPSDIEKVILGIDPWAIINTAGFLRVDDAETESGSCFAINTHGPENLATVCEKFGIKLMTFSTDLVFDGLKSQPYLERDKISPLNIYGHSKALAEHKVLQQNPEALVIRTSAFFGPWDKDNFIKLAIDGLRAERHFSVANDVTLSPIYVPDLVHTSLDLMLDNEKGIWHLSNHGKTSFASLAYSVAERLGLKTSFIRSMPLRRLGYKAKRPLYSVLNSERGSILPTLDHAIDRCLREINYDAEVRK
ncbi:MAG: dTDP-4-dehydrorhamnose reductase [Mucilaginibacter sp.]|nr:dTDP-4-dehydrorhamnose reductase [Mucilaginibacter sp.]